MRNDTPPLEGREYDATDIGPLGDSDKDPKTMTDGDWLGLVRAAWTSSTDFLDEKYRKQINKNVANFQSRHPDGSKYYNETYATRSKLFRPKTRTAARKNEAALAGALFSASDVVVIEAEDMDNPSKRKDASFWHEVVNYRLNKTIPWFMTAIGAFQEAGTYGHVVSKQFWEYEEKQVGEELAMLNGQPKVDENGQYIVLPSVEIVKDRPKIQLIEFENFRFDPAADWVDPINASPYLIEVKPMYLIDVMQRMEAQDPKTGTPQWKPLSRVEVLRYGRMSDQKDDSTASAREKKQETEVEHYVTDFEKVFILENIFRMDGQDWVFYTVGYGHMLTDPVPLDDVYAHGSRPYVRGICIIEAHRSIPAGTVELTEQLQAESNDQVNIDLDLKKRASNPMKYISRTAKPDFWQLKNRTIGGMVLMDDINGIKEEQLSNVPGSAFAERNRLDADFDDLAGVFSVGSVQSNRQLGETVGGMEMMSQYANKESEYLIRTFVETWVEPVLGQLVMLEQHYEENELILSMALSNVSKKEADLTQQNPEAAGGEVTAQPEPKSEVPLKEPQTVDVRVNVGFGNLNPDQRIQRIMTGINTMVTIAPYMASKLNVEETAGAVFGALGHKDGSRFFTDFNPPEPQTPPEVQIEQMKMQLDAERLKLEQMKTQADGQLQVAKLQLEEKLGMAKIAAQQDMSMKELYAKLGIESKKIEVAEKKAGADNLTRLSEIERKENELAFKERTGRQGI